MIPQRNLSLLSNRLARAGGRRIGEAILERDYCLAWFLVGLARSALRDHLYFKGGTALKRCYFADYRFSEDLDFTLAQPMALEQVLHGLEAVYAEVEQASGIRFRYSRVDRRLHTNSHTFYLRYEGPLATVSTREVKVDITIRERLTSTVVDRPVLRGYTEYEDLPDDAHVRAYSLDEIGVEKLVALTDRARHEPRDLYDLWALTKDGHVDLGILVPGIEQKLEFRGRTRASLNADLERKQARLAKLWHARLGAQLVTLPPFESVLRAVRRALRAARLIERA